MGLLSTIGGAIGLVVGGPIGAALGAGIGTLASGGDIGDALKSGIMGFGIGSIPGVSSMIGGLAGSVGMTGVASNMAAQAGAQQAANQALFKGSGIAGLLQGAGGGAGAGAGAAAGGLAGAGAGAAGGLQGILSNPMTQNLILASLIEAGEPKPTPLTALEKRQLKTGERVPDYQGTMAPGTPRATLPPGTAPYAQGGYVRGPGTGKSDSIPAAIYQNGGRVQEARLSDGEFVMTADAVRGAGGGSRDVGAAKMYELMRQYERRAANA